MEQVCETAFSACSLGRQVVEMVDRPVAVSHLELSGGAEGLFQPGLDGAE
jgi:hypothetical protein